MPNTPDFTQEIQQLKIALRQAKNDLEKLNELFQQSAIETNDARRALEKLRQSLPGSQQEKTSKKKTTFTIQPLDVAPHSGRPSRGARRDQIIAICQHLSISATEFRTIEVIRILTSVEGSLSSGMRSYIYSLMDSLERDGVLLKVGHGRWRLNPKFQHDKTHSRAWRRSTVLKSGDIE